MGLRLAFIGSINDEILNKEELAAELLKFMGERYPETLKERYDVEPGDPYEMLGQIARARACLLKGNEYDYKKAANLFLDGRLGRMTLEFPPQEEKADEATER